ncbi:MAG TPA: alanine racemase [Sediminispirochaeta sp.]|nr:alanine racemase [Sediminispirochaeta sp.]
MGGPSVRIDLDKIENNARVVCNLCAEHGIQVTGVSKVSCGTPAVARALLRGGVKGIGESRMENIHRLRANGVVEPITLLRIPPLSETEEIVRSVDVSLNSEISVIRSLSSAAERFGLNHRVILMIDLGDLREGFWPDDVLPAVREVLELPNISLEGVGTNLTCYGGVIPTPENMQQLVDWAHRIEDTFDIHIRTISGGNSSSLPLLASGKMPQGINNLRIGEAILLGRETVKRQVWPGTEQDAFLIEAELIELKEKPSVPIGETGEDAFGGRPTFVDKGLVTRGILNIGREDADVDGLRAMDGRIEILGASSDHLIVEMGAAKDEYSLGQSVSFLPNYSALLAAMTSAYVQKNIHGKAVSEHKPKKVLLFSASNHDLEVELLSRSLASIGFELELPAKNLRGEEDFFSAIRSSLSAGSFPLLRGRRFLSSTGFSAASIELGQQGLLWISPSPSIIVGEKKKELHTDDLGPLGRILAPDLLELGWIEASEKKSDDQTAPSAENIVLLGLQEARPVEVEIIRSLGLNVYTMEDIDMLGISAVVRKALQRAVIGSQGLFVHYDPRISDGGQEGLSNRETHLMMEMIARSGFMRLLDVSGAAIHGRGRGSLQKFIASALGKRILGV